MAVEKSPTASRRSRRVMHPVARDGDIIVMPATAGSQSTPATLPRRKRGAGVTRQRVSRASRGQANWGGIVICASACVCVCALLGWLAAPAAAATIQVTITDESTSSPLAGIDIDVYDASTSNVGGKTTDQVGFEEVTGLPAGSYVVKADASKTQYYVDEYYDNAVSLSTATPITATANQVVAIAMALQPGGLIRGTVRDTQGAALAGIDLDLEDAAGTKLAYSATSGDGNVRPVGTYELGAVPPGTYYLRTDPAYGAGTPQHYQRRYYPDAPDRTTAQPIIVVAGADQQSIDFALPAGYYIAGGATAAAGGGAPVAGLDLDVLDAATGVKITAAGGITDANGQYAIGALPPGTYKVRVDPRYPLHYLRQYFAGASDPAGATILDLASADATGVDFSVAEGAYISGLVQSAGTGTLAGIDLDVYDAFGNLLETSATSDASGQYILGPLPAGAYRVKADPVYPQPYANQYYTGSSSLAGATAVPVTPPADVAAIDFALIRGAFVSGSVTTAEPRSPSRAVARAPLGGVRIRLRDAGGALTGPTAISDAATGVFHAGPVSAGTYHVQAAPAQGLNRVGQYYAGQSTEASATDVVVADAEVTGIDFALATGGMAEGTITSSAGGPVNVAKIEVYDLAGTQYEIDQVTTLPDGTYRVDGLPNASWFLRALPPVGLGDAAQFYGQALVLEHAQVFATAAGAISGGIDVQLAAAASVTGSVVDDQSSAPLAGFDIDIWDAGWNRILLSGDQTAADGTFDIGGLPAGDYYLRVDSDPTAQQGYVDVYYDGSGGQVSDALNAGTLAMVPPAATTGLDFRLRKGGAIEGRITRDDTQNGVTGVSLRLYDGGGALVPETLSSGTNGVYHWGGLADGQYHLYAQTRVDGDGAVLLAEYYNDASNLADATAITITSGGTRAGIDIGLTVATVPALSGVSALVALGAAVAALARRRGSGAIRERERDRCASAE
ncbi:MAG: hypothetical protein HYV63_10055 [Candidatus Schekmanbacteria bacterium]|nr:hypothetical protein [Candidatus Schekmanbacteria bacterium]